LSGALKLDPHMMFECDAFYPNANLSPALFPDVFVVVLRHSQFRQSILYDKGHETLRLVSNEGSDECGSLLPTEVSPIVLIVAIAITA
jgi:hypothetical protein